MGFKMEKEKLTKAMPGAIYEGGVLSLSALEPRALLCEYSEHLKQ